MQCLICLEESEEKLFVAHQGHNHCFHHECIAGWINTLTSGSTRCPYCNTSLENLKDLRHLLIQMIPEYCWDSTSPYLLKVVLDHSYVGIVKKMVKLLSLAASNDLACIEVILASFSVNELTTSIFDSIVDVALCHEHYDLVTALFEKQIVLATDIDKAMSSSENLKRYSAQQFLINLGATHLNGPYLKDDDRLFHSSQTLVTAGCMWDMKSFESLLDVGYTITTTMIWRFLSSHWKKPLEILLKRGYDFRSLGDIFVKFAFDRAYFDIVRFLTETAGCFCPYDYRLLRDESYERGCWNDFKFYHDKLEEKGDLNVRQKLILASLEPNINDLELLIKEGHDLEQFFPKFCHYYKTHDQIKLLVEHGYDMRSASVSEYAFGQQTPDLVRLLVKNKSIRPDHALSGFYLSVALGKKDGKKETLPFLKVLQEINAFSFETREFYIFIWRPLVQDIDRTAIDYLIGIMGIKFLITQRRLVEELSRTGEFAEMIMTLVDKGYPVSSHRGRLLRDAIDQGNMKLFLFLLKNWPKFDPYTIYWLLYILPKDHNHIPRYYYTKLLDPQKMNDRVITWIGFFQDPLYAGKIISKLMKLGLKTLNESFDLVIGINSYELMNNFVQSHPEMIADVQNVLVKAIVAPPFGQHRIIRWVIENYPDSVSVDSDVVELTGLYRNYRASIVIVKEHCRRCRYCRKFGECDIDEKMFEVQKEIMYTHYALARGLLDE